MHETYEVIKIVLLTGICALSWVIYESIWILIGEMQ